MASSQRFRAAAVVALVGGIAWIQAAQAMGGEQPLAANRHHLLSPLRRVSRASVNATASSHRSSSPASWAWRYRNARSGGRP